MSEATATQPAHDGDEDPKVRAARAAAAGGAAVDSVLLPVPAGRPREAGSDPGDETRAARALAPSRLRNMRNDIDEEQARAVAEQVGARHGVEPVARAPVDPPPPPRRAIRRPTCPLNPEIEMPYEGEEIDWTGNLRADFPVYVLEQLNEFCHRHKCTQVSALLQFMAAYGDQNGRPVFHIRPEDMVPDRRKAPKRRR